MATVFAVSGISMESMGKWGMYGLYVWLGGGGNDDRSSLDVLLFLPHNQMLNPSKFIGNIQRKGSH